MKVLLFFLAANVAFSAEWNAVQRIPRDSRIEVRTSKPENVRGTFVSADEMELVMHSKFGEQSVARGAIRRVLLADPSRRVRNGVIATGIGAGIGLTIGVAICPYCANEGAAWKYTGPLTAVGAVAGAAVGFLPLPYRTVYKSK